jgi:archaemetzincin
MECDQDLVPRLQTGNWGWWLGLPLLLLVTTLLYVGGKESGHTAATAIIPADQSQDLGVQVMAPAEFPFSSPKLGYTTPGSSWFAEAKVAQQRLRALRIQGPSHAQGDWLASHPEPGQTFAEYLATKPVRPTEQRHVIYVQPLAMASTRHRDVVLFVADFLSRYFRLQVRVLAEQSAAVVPLSTTRKRGGQFQLHTGTVMQHVLMAHMPTDALAVLAFTSLDLYNAPSWNFVFGEASWEHHVGVFSLARFGDADRDSASFKLLLLRALKTATHEAGHMLGLAHCTAQQCNMNGANSLEEADHAPLALCPDCLAKVCWLTATPLQQWLQDVYSFLRTQKLNGNQEFLEQLRMVKARPEPDAEDRRMSRPRSVDGTPQVSRESHTLGQPGYSAKGRRSYANGHAGPPLPSSE